MAKKSKFKSDGVSPDKRGFDFIPPSAREQLHIRELQAEVEKAKAVLERQDRMDALYFIQQCQNEAMQEMDIFRLAPYEIDAEGRYSKQLLRYWFLQTISDAAPIVWEQLRDNAYSIYYNSGRKHEVRDWLDAIATILSWKKEQSDFSILDKAYQNLKTKGFTGSTLSFQLCRALNIRHSATLFDMPNVVGLEMNALTEEGYRELTEAEVDVEMNPNTAANRRFEDFHCWEALEQAEDAYAYELSPLRNGLIEWAQSRNLKTAWLLDWTLRMMHLWRIPLYLLQSMYPLL